MGAAIPDGIAVNVAYSDRSIIAVVGDGAMQMNDMAELITGAKHWQEWSNRGRRWRTPPVVKYWTMIASG